MKKRVILLIVILIIPEWLLATVPVNTFSIVGCDPQTGELGIAVASKYFAVGSIVPWAKAGVGAIATQSYVNPDYGILGLELLEQGLTPQQAIDSLTRSDVGAAKRQAGIINFKGDAITYTGPECLYWAGGKIGKNCAAQGNILVSDTVVTNMVQAFEKTQGELSDKLLAALLAGDSAGGDSRGKESAALYVVQMQPGTRYDRKIDIRVDDSPEPFVEITRLYKMAKSLAHLQTAAQNNQAGDLKGAVKEARLAVQLGPRIPETYYDLACYLSLAGQYDEALSSIATALELGPNLKPMAARDPDLTGLRNRPEFQQLIR